MDSYFEELINRYTDNIIKEGENIYAIRVMGRGEDLFFRENEKCLICEINAENGIIYKKSIKCWDSIGKRMNTKEKERVTTLIYKFYRQVYNPDVILK